ncbi:MAG: urocanate hydratase [Tenericutes bacterium GWC2_34_14]|nr:MAG: urocanate hydratase [Tenericutes bacterium GWC2_34_14]OHE35030.1 MAG: urocanate hydratase [Tenericutes bacterium GWE2_34_108]OHE37110.1 MAG: urocanate hydratase [Tenericutes bacterium GWF1_35_14]OHE39758.1 MAG: urocanate hydratase [Tenericutes bacterium GWF2_35_184]OHE43988.1 MAG: urocanate hydratase [Tenericutes bacterium RIFOXYA12_FULL_35_10]OHE44054.1 MAG: urocanate hydratase [Tenericutes bacterium RIFOXYA2_FULL_36_32]OHE47520.1 MAG: urocanate hydratase [Tenericutes bacterium RIFOX
MRSITLKDIFQTLPEPIVFDQNLRRAPKRTASLSSHDIELALKNALRYIPQEWQDELIPEFLTELMERGRIYGYRFRPKELIFGKPIESYQASTLEGKAFMVMIDNNLDPQVALYPYELVTYGETGQVCQNWMQYHLIKKYLEIMTHQETLTVMSGHPLGLFDSHERAPRVIITNGLMVGMYDHPTSFERAQALGVANYGQMTAGGWMYIGPQGIVHGTYSTLLNAGRLKLGISNNQNLAGKLFVSSGLGGMSGAQGKAIHIAGGVGIIAEVDMSRIVTRLKQGWIDRVTDNQEEAFHLAREAQIKQEALAIAYHGNIVDLLACACMNHVKIDLLSDQTSCHAVYEGGYCPYQLSFSKRTEMLKHDQEKFKALVNESLIKHYHYIEELVSRGTYFFDYGNAFLKSVYDAGETSMCKNGVNDLEGFNQPSYVEELMGPLLFDYGYGPFRWVCLSGKQEDLDLTDLEAMKLIPKDKRFQDYDNYMWIKNAKDNALVVGTKARILYQDAEGRLKIALKFNELVREGLVGPIMLGRDHHDTGGTDSPFRETANIKDGSNIMADMATHVALGNASRGMSLVALHNGGGVGVGKSINGGYGMVLDGSLRVDEILKEAMIYDVMAGVSRRAWATNDHAIETALTFNQNQDRATITIPFLSDEEKIKQAIKNYKKGN